LRKVIKESFHVVSASPTKSSSITLQSIATSDVGPRSRHENTCDNKKEKEKGFVGTVDLFSHSHA
jgi:hypothetical protein